MNKVVSKIRIYTKSFFNSSTSKNAALVLFSLVVILIVGTMILGQNSMQTVYAKNTRLITIYDNSAPTKAIVTRAKTTGDILKAAGISVNSKDEVSSTLNSNSHATIAVINITRARNITVVDGSRKINIFTAAQSNSAIAEAAKVPLLSHDSATLSTSNDLSGRGAGLVLTIVRAKTVHLVLYGSSLTLRTQQKNVADFLKENNIKLAKGDTISVNQSSKIVDGMSLEIWRNGLQTVSSNEVINFSTQKIDDATKNVGYDQITTPGQNGQQTCVYQVNMQNGQELSRNQISCVTTIQPVTQVEVVGTKVSLPAGSHTDWMNAAGIPSSDQGYVNYIFLRESGWRPGATNGTYYGLGQTSLSTLINACGVTWASDPICQIGVFNNYAISRYGSWAAAQAAWEARAEKGNGWW